MTKRERQADLTDSEYRRLAAFRHALRHFLRFSEEAARAQGLTPNQHQLLLAVRGWPREGSPGISEIAEQLELKVHSTVELARRAADAGLVTLTTDPTDQRRQLVDLTSLGRDHLKALTVMHRDELRRFRLHLSDLLEILEHET